MPTPSSELQRAAEEAIRNEFRRAAWHLKWVLYQTRRTVHVALPGRRYARR